jgi:hypothetical protein
MGAGDRYRIGIGNLLLVIGYWLLVIGKFNLHNIETIILNNYDFSPLLRILIKN